MLKMRRILVLGLTAFFKNWSRCVLRMFDLENV